MQRDARDVPRNGAGEPRVSAEAVAEHGKAEPPHQQGLEAEARHQQAEQRHGGDLAPLADGHGRRRGLVAEHSEHFCRIHVERDKRHGEQPGDGEEHGVVAVAEQRERAETHRAAPRFSLPERRCVRHPEGNDPREDPRSGGRVADDEAAVRVERIARQETGDHPPQRRTQPHQWVALFAVVEVRKAERGEQPPSGAGDRRIKGDPRNEPPRMQPDIEHAEGQENGDRAEQGAPAHEFLRGDALIRQRTADQRGKQRADRHDGKHRADPALQPLGLEDVGERRHPEARRHAMEERKRPKPREHTLGLDPFHHAPHLAGNVRLARLLANAETRASSQVASDELRSPSLRGKTLFVAKPPPRSPPRCFRRTDRSSPAAVAPMNSLPGSLTTLSNTGQTEPV